jgi:hypothetical protein
MGRNIKTILLTAVCSIFVTLAAQADVRLIDDRGEITEVSWNVSYETIEVESIPDQPDSKQRSGRAKKVKTKTLVVHIKLPKDQQIEVRDKRAMLSGGYLTLPVHGYPVTTQVLISAANRKTRYSMLVLDSPFKSRTQLAKDEQERKEKQEEIKRERRKRMIASIEEEEAKILPSKSLADYDPMTQSVRPPKRIAFNVGVGMSYVGYNETPTNIKIGQAALTAKGGLSYALIPNRWYIDASTYFNVVPVGLNIQPAGTKTARFWGFNLRVGYQVPKHLGPASFRLLGGVFAWGMLTAGNAYGLSSLIGPQIFLETTFHLANDDPRLRTYLKYAPIGQSLSDIIGFSKSEIAAGLSYRLSKKTAKNPISLTADASRVSVKKIQNALNTFSLTSGSLGLSVGF